MEGTLSLKVWDALFRRNVNVIPGYLALGQDFLEIAGAALAQHQVEAQGMSPNCASRAAHLSSKILSSCKSKAIRRSTL